MNKAKLKAYMVYDRIGGSSECAVLAFAYSAKQARKIGWPYMADFAGSEWIDVAVRWLKNSLWLFKQMIQDAPHVIDSPEVCPCCELWGGEIYDAGHCSYCGGEG